MSPMDTITMPYYPYIFHFEEEFDHVLKRDWMSRNWKQCFYYIGVYMLLIFGGQHYMQTRSRFQLRKTLFVWNFFLAVFSIFGASRTVPELLHVINEYGFQHSVCIPSFIEHNKVSGFWTWMFTISKVPELGDTIFIVLRKQPLIFLHWYHHVTVLVYTWYAYSQYTAPGRWFIAMNYLVHSAMYSYYACKALKLRIPRWVSMVITTAQLAQMIIGCYVNIWTYQAKQRGEDCHISYENIKVSLMMYFSYFLLFSQFFYNAYLKKPFDKNYDKFKIAKLN